MILPVCSSCQLTPERTIFSARSRYLAGLIAGNAGAGVRVISLRTSSSGEAAAPEDEIKNGCDIKIPFDQYKSY